MIVSRKPAPALRPFIKRLWVADPSSDGLKAREHVLPTSQMHLVFRLEGPALRLFESADDAFGYSLGHATVGGARSGFYIRDTSAPACSVGAQLQHGVAPALFGVTADELSNRHTALDQLWGNAVESLCQQLLEAQRPMRQLQILEASLSARLEQAGGLHPVIAGAIDQFAVTHEVDTVVRNSPISHRHFIKMFRQATGLSPKRYCRVKRFQNALHQHAENKQVSWAEIAAGSGYSDQAHFIREFRHFSGMTPQAYKSSQPRHRNHVPV